MNNLIISLFIFLSSVLFLAGVKAEDLRYKPAGLPIVSISEYGSTSMDDSNDQELAYSGKGLKIEGFMPDSCYKFPIYKEIKYQKDAIEIELWADYDTKSDCLEYVRYFSEKITMDRLPLDRKINVVINPDSKHRRDYIIGLTRPE